MPEQHAAFVGTVPPNYDRYLGPILFHHYADDLAARVPVTTGRACWRSPAGPES